MRFELLNASSRECCFRIAEPFLSFQNHACQHLQYTSEYGNLMTDLIEPFLTIFVYSAINSYSPMLRRMIVDISRPRLISTTRTDPEVNNCFCIQPFQLTLSDQGLRGKTER